MRAGARPCRRRPTPCRLPRLALLTVLCCGGGCSSRCWACCWPRPGSPDVERRGSCGAPHWRAAIRWRRAARLAALSFIVLAITDAPLPMLDRSRNIAVVAGPHLGAGDHGTELTGRIYDAAKRDKASGGDARLGIVTIDANGHVAADLGDSSNHNPVAGQSSPPLAADLENALAVAAAMLPADAPGQIVVASDGNETRGNAARLLPAIIGRGIRVDVLPMTPLAAGEVLVEKVTAPERVFAGDTFPLEAVIYSYGPSMATIEVVKDGGVIIERALELAGGRSRIETIVPAATPGRSRYEVV